MRDTGTASLAARLRARVVSVLGGVTVFGFAFMVLAVDVVAPMTATLLASPPAGMATGHLAVRGDDQARPAVAAAVLGGVAILVGWRLVAAIVTGARPEWFLAALPLAVVSAAVTARRS